MYQIINLLLYTSGSEMEMIPPFCWHLENLETILIVKNARKDTIDIWLVESKDAPQYPPMHRITWQPSHIHRTSYLAPNINSAKVEKHGFR